MFEAALSSVLLIRDLATETDVLNELAAAIDHNYPEALESPQVRLQLGIVRNILTRIGADNSVQKVLDLLYELQQ